MHIAAADPRYLRREDVPAAVLEKEKEIAARPRALEGKPEKILDRIVEGRLTKFYEEVCLLEQPFVKEATLTIEQLVKTKIAKLGENIGDRALRPLQGGRRGGGRSRRRESGAGTGLAVDGRLQAHPAEAERRSAGGRGDFRHRRRARQGSLAREVAGCGRGRRADRRGGGRRQYFSRRGRRGPEHGPRDGRPHGHAGHRHQLPGALRTRWSRSASPRA